MDKSEIHKLQAFMRRSFGNETIRVAVDPRHVEKAEMHFGERKLASISVDDEDGDRSFSLDMRIPVGRAVLQEYLQKLFDNPKLKVHGRLKKNDSVELNNGDDFLGIISADDPQGSSYTLQMAVLDFDLDEV